MEMSMAAAPFKPERAWRGWVFGGLVSASLDLLYVCTLFAFRDVSPVRIFQSIATGWQGPAAFEGGAASATLGFFSHYGILLIAAAMFQAASRYIPWMTRHWFQAGAAYGLCIWLTMRYVILPLSNAPQFGSTTFSFVTNLLVHLFVIGTSLSWCVRRFGYRRD